MSTRIESIKYLVSEEHKHLKDAWNNLNAWAHPYGKWEKEICPIYYSSQPLYHPQIYKECYYFLTVLVDLFLTIAVERFQIAPAEITESVRKIGGDIIDDSFKLFPLFFKRLKNANNAFDNKRVHSDAPEGGA